MNRTEIRDGLVVRGFRDDFRDGTRAGVALHMGGGRLAPYVLQDLTIAEARALAKALEDAASYAEQAVQG